MEEAGGVLVGSSDYSHEMYNEAGVAWQQNTWSQDEFYYHGKRISQEKAKKIVDWYNSHGKEQPHDDVVELF